MQSTVIELSRYTSIDTNSNAEWTNTLSKPLIIDNQDYIMIKQAFIDTRQIDQQSILIDNDVTLTIQFAYYINSHGIQQVVYDPASTPGDLKTKPSTPDGLPYLLQYVTTYPEFTPPTYQTLVDSIQITIPQGIYERSYLAEYMTRQFQQIKQPQNRKLNTLNFTNGQLIPQYDANNNYTGLLPVDIPTDKTSIITTPMRPLYTAHISTGEIVIAPPIINLYADGNGGLNFCAFNPLCNDQKYNLDPLDSENFYTITSDKLPQTYTYNGDVPYELYDGGYIGTSEFSFTYNDQNSGRFAFQYLHSPIINNGNECVGEWSQSVSTNEQPNVAFLNAYSGIIIVDIFTNLPKVNNVDPFLEQLGFNYNDIVSPHINHIFDRFTNFPLIWPGFINYSEFLKYTTRNYPSIASLTGNQTLDIGNYKISSYASIFSKAGYEFSDSTTTNEIFATNTPVSSATNAGHYLIDLQCSYVNEYVTQEKSYQIKAIIGNYFLSGDSFCMSMGPDSYVFQNNGQPLTLSSISVKILNPITKEPALNLGENSTIYLQLTKEKPIIKPTDETSKQPEKKK